MKRLAVAFTGPSNSGKTTLIVKVSNILQDQGKKVAIIKHDPKDKASFDREGKDSFKFTQTKADVAVISPKRTTIFKQSQTSLEDIINVFDSFDYLLVEGLKTLDLPRVCIFRNRVDSDYFEVSDVLAIDESVELNLDIKNSSMKILDLNNPYEIIDWINEKGKEV
jgi:molybdopterin-guanine dinucleotide biosynthesis protein B